MKNASIEERFYEKVMKAAGCWLWTGQRPNGYGRLDVYVPKRTTYAAHRLSYELHRGKIPKDAHVLHTCDNPACVRPSHLFLGDQHSNNKDMLNKGRNVRGEKFPHSKLTRKSVLEIRARYAERNVTQQSLADEYGVSISQINGVVKCKTWQHK